MRWFAGNAAVSSARLMLAVLSGVAGHAAHASSETVLYSFLGNLIGADPNASLARDDLGNLYGTTATGGAHNLGVLFRLAPDGTMSVIHAFSDRVGSAHDETKTEAGLNDAGGTLKIGRGGDLFGTSFDGPGNMSGYIYKINKTGHFSLIYVFKGAPDGAFPNAGLTRDRGGAMFGITGQGGSYANPNGGDPGDGTIFRVTRQGQETVMHSFGGAGDGFEPNSTLLLDKTGNLYGTTEGGFGTVFKMSASGSEAVIHAFQGYDDGADPRGPLVMDKAGNLYGATYSGGPGGQGQIFKIAPDGTKSLFYAFGAFAGDGGFPTAGPIIDPQGNLYGTTLSGGAANAGTVYKIAPDGSETILYSFSGKDGYLPTGGLVRDAAGHLYGITGLGGDYGGGVIFEVTP
jgi:uncharacterized repeat protein (TIGR03803 family)